MNEQIKTAIWLVYVPILIWSVLLICYIIWLSNKYTFGKWDQDKNKNPYCDETLGMPRGTMRGLLTLTVLFVAIVLEVFTLQYDKHEQNTHEFIVAFQMVLAFYFGSQIMGQVTSAEKARTESMGKSMVEAEKAKNNTAAGGEVAAEKAEG
jgi:hypothetical protein